MKSIMSSNATRYLTGKEIFWLKVLSDGVFTQNQSPNGKGEFYWSKKPNKNYRCRIGDEVGSFDIEGYRRIGFNYKSIKAHQLSFLLKNGYIPKCIDHINHKKDDNRPINLRDATISENGQNRKGAMINSKSGHIGVISEKRKGIFTGKWRSFIKINSNNIYLGVFDNISEAINARNEAELKYFTHSPSNNISI